MEIVEKILRPARSAVVVTVRTCRLVQHNWEVLVVALGAASVLAAAYWHVMSFPSQVIRDYYGEVGLKAYQSAWDRLDPSFSEKRWSGYDQFVGDYSGTVSHHIERMTRIDISPWQVWEAAERDTAIYEVDLYAEDRFTAGILADDRQALNERWLRIRHSNAEVDAIKSGLMTSDNQRSLSLKRRFLLEVEVKRSGRRWLVSNFRWRQVAVVWRSEK